MITRASTETVYELLRLPEDEVRRRFQVLKARLAYLYRNVFPHRHLPRTVIVVPSLTLDQEVLAKVKGIHYYEERMLYHFMLLQMPRTQVIYITSQALHPVVVDYFLGLLPGVPISHARKRLVLLHCQDASPRSLTEKILARPRLIQRLRELIQYPQAAYLEVFNSTPYERRLAVALNVPLYACDPDLMHLGNKSWNRKIFQKAGVPHPPGFEDLRDEQDLVEAIVALKQQHPDLRRVVIKLNEGFSGEGNAIFELHDAPTAGLKAWVREQLPRRLRFENPVETYERFMRKFREMQGIVEVFLEGQGKRSPSVQGLINPLGEGIIVSTHEQILGGPTKQVYLGATFPADPAYRAQLHEMGRRVGWILSQEGAIGRFSVDFVALPPSEPEGNWRLYALEINLRKGGTTHPYETLRFLTGGQYELEEGEYVSGTKTKLYYYATDNLYSAEYIGLTPEDLMDLSLCEGLHFDAATQEGIVFHLIGALSEFGKLGAVCIGRTPENAEEFYHRALKALQRAARGRTKCDQPPTSTEGHAVATHFQPYWAKDTPLEP